MAIHSDPREIGTVSGINTDHGNSPPRWQNESAARLLERRRKCAGQDQKKNTSSNFLSKAMQSIKANLAVGQN